jgi:hypothetical protein
MALIMPAEIVDKAGTGIQFGYDLKDGKINDAVYSLVATFTSEAIGGVLDKAKDAKKITNTDKGILNLVSDTWSKVADFFYDKSKEKDKK